MPEWNPHVPCAFNLTLLRLELSTAVRVYCAVVRQKPQLKTRNPEGGHWAVVDARVRPKINVTHIQMYRASSHPRMVLVTLRVPHSVQKHGAIEPLKVLRERCRHASSVVGEGI